MSTNKNFVAIGLPVAIAIFTLLFFLFNSSMVLAKRPNRKPSPSSSPTPSSTPSPSPSPLPSCTPDTFITSIRTSTALPYSRTVIQTLDGGFAVVGSIYSTSSNYDLIVIKTDRCGNILWSKTIGGTGLEEGESLAQASNGDILVLGETRSFGAGGGDFLLARFDSSGNLSWAKTIGQAGYEYGLSISPTSDDGFIVTGSSSSFTGYPHLTLMKLDSTSNVEWAKSVHTQYQGTLGRSVKQTAEGGYIVAGETGNDCINCNEFYLVKFDGSGNLVWSKSGGESLADVFLSVAQTSDGEYIMGGASNNFGSGGSGNILVKSNGNGVVLWSRFIAGGAGNFSSVIQTSDGGYLSTGQYTENGSYLLMMKLGITGDAQWAKKVNTNGGNGGKSAIQDSGGGLVAAGSYVSYGTLLLRSDPNGNIENCPNFVTASQTFSSPVVTLSDQASTVTSRNFSISTISPNVGTPTLTNTNRC